VERDAKVGDYVRVNYDDVLADRVAIADAIRSHKIYGKRTNTREKVGNVDVSTGVQAVIQGVIGLKTGDNGKAEEVFPEDFSISELAGKKRSAHSKFWRFASASIRS
jgi:FKBP-type peptidyl-prolyl cis-trans isomerase (trigger factor)